MELLILDENFNGIDTLDVFESLIWTDRYCGCGDFEIYVPATEKMLSKLQKDRYLYLRESKYLMIIEDVEIQTDTEEGSRLCVTGRSLESILERRIIWYQTVLSGSFQDGIEKLLNENAISPSDGKRKIPNLIFEKSQNEAITGLTLEAQYWGENLYDTILDICNSAGIGFEILLSGKNLIFSLYTGEDRSYDQIQNPYVIFSPEFDNLLNSNYIKSDKTLKTVTLVTGEGEGSNKKTTTVEIEGGGGSGLKRRELYTDAGDISQTVDNAQISDSDYLNQLKQRGEEELSKNKATNSFEGQIDSNATYSYGIDYYLGDIVQVKNEYGCESKSKITEYIRSQNESGIEEYPSFEPV